MAASAPPAPSFAQYQTRHNIEPIESDEPGRYFCGVDQIRVHRMPAGSWRHDAAQITALFDAWLATIWPSAERAAALR